MRWSPGHQRGDLAAAAAFLRTAGLRTPAHLELLDVWRRQIAIYRPHLGGLACHAASQHWQPAVQTVYHACSMTSYRRHSTVTATRPLCTDLEARTCRLACRSPAPGLPAGRCGAWPCEAGAAAPSDPGRPALHPLLPGADWPRSCMLGSKPQRHLPAAASQLPACMLRADVAKG